MNKLYRFFDIKDEMVAMVSCKSKEDVIAVAKVLSEINESPIKVKTENDSCFLYVLNNNRKNF